MGSTLCGCVSVCVCVAVRACVRACCNEVAIDSQHKQPPKGSQARQPGMCVGVTGQTCHSPTVNTIAAMCVRVTCACV